MPPIVAQIKSPAQRKRTGAHYTPKELALFLAKRLVLHLGKRLDAIRVLDPACGDGELLRALAEELPEKIRDSSIFIGFDQDSEAVESLYKNWHNGVLDGRVEDFLSLSFDHKEIMDMFDEDYEIEELADLIIANPPYVRTQVLGAERAQQLAIEFDLTGRVDLYHAFLVAMTAALKVGGLLGVITSNRFLTTRGGATIRQFLESNFDILEVIDLGDTKLFEAAVLPAIFIGRKRAKETKAKAKGKFIRIYEDTTSESTLTIKSIYDILDSKVDGTFEVGKRIFKRTTGSITLHDPTEPWKLVCESERSWLKEIESVGKLPLGTLMNIRVGIKTTADSIFIRDDWAAIPEKIRPEADLLRHIISSEDCKRWITDSSELNKQILYPYTSVDGKKQLIDLASYPRALSYFERHKDRLAGRKYIQESNRKWYEIWVPHNPTFWDQPMIVTPDISPTPKFFFTSGHATVNGNCYWLTLRPGLSSDYLFLVLGVVNSKLMTRYHDLAFNNKLYAGRRRYLTQYIEKYPIPEINSPNAAQVVELVKSRIFEVMDKRSQLQLEANIDETVDKLFGF